MTMEKVKRDGKVAVLYSPGFGAGWYTWHNVEAMIFHPRIVELVEAGKQSEITEELCKELLGLSESDYFCALGAVDLKIAWLDEGAQFHINEYDGSENVESIDTLTLTA